MINVRAFFLNLSLTLLLLSVLLIAFFFSFLFFILFPFPLFLIGIHGSCAGAARGFTTSLLAFPRPLGLRVLSFSSKRALGLAFRGRGYARFWTVLADMPNLTTIVTL